MSSGGACEPCQGCAREPLGTCRLATPLPGPAALRPAAHARPPPPLPSAPEGHLQHLARRGGGAAGPCPPVSRQRRRHPAAAGGGAELPAARAVGWPAACARAPRACACAGAGAGAAAAACCADRPGEPCNPSPAHTLPVAALQVAMQLDVGAARRGRCSGRHRDDTCAACGVRGRTWMLKGGQFCGCL